MSKSMAILIATVLALMFVSVITGLDFNGLMSGCALWWAITAHYRPAHHENEQPKEQP